MTSDRFSHSTYLVRKRILSVLGGKFEIFDPAGNMVLFSKQAAFKLKEDIRLFTDESMTTELVSIKARSIMDFSAAYDVVDTMTGHKVGGLRRKGWKSMFRDEWIVMDAYDTEVGGIQEESAVLAFLRRFVTNLIPQTYNVQIGGTSVAGGNGHRLVIGTPADIVDAMEEWFHNGAADGVSHRLNTCLP